MLLEKIQFILKKIIAGVSKYPILYEKSNKGYVAKDANC